MEIIQRKDMCPPIDVKRMSRNMAAKTKLYNADELIALCRSTGLMIDREDVEQYEKDGLLFPVPFDNQTSPLYSEDQILILELLKNDWKIVLRHGDIDVDQETWVKKRTGYKKLFVAKKERLKKEIEIRYRGIELYYGIQHLRTEQKEYAEYESAYDVDLSDREKYKERVRWHKEDWEKERFKTACKEFLRVYKINKKELIDYARYFARIGFSLDPFVRNWRLLFEHFKDKSIIQREGGIIRYVYKCYSLTFQFLWVLKLLNVSLTFEEIYKEQNLANLFTYFHDSRYCVICNEIFEVSKSNQITCGNPVCVKESSRRNQALKRKAR